MLHPFVNASAAPSHHPAILLASAALHAAIVYLALGPKQGAHFSERPEASAEQVRFATLPLGAVPLRPSIYFGMMQRGAESRRSPQSGRLLVDLRSALPTLSSPLTTRGDADAPDEADSRQFGGIVLRGAPEPSVPLMFPDYAFEPEEVELTAVPAPANPKPNYPATMLRRGVEARFAVFFVVDTSGHVEGSTVELPLIPHEEFTHAVLEVLHKWRFVPAEVSGRHVRERVKQRFQFQIR